MLRRAIFSAFGVAVLAGSASAAAAPALTSSPAAGTPGATHVPVCGPPVPGSARCHADLLLDPAHNWQGSHVPAAPGGGAASASSTSPGGYYPADLQSAYGLTSLSAGSGAGKTVAIVDAYDDPNAFADLGVYRSRFGLPPIANSASGGCTTNSKTPCLVKENQSGAASPLPSGNTSWSEEISLDLEMVSATCPNCNILLVEASSNSFSNLITAEGVAVATPGVAAVSNSYGANQFSGEKGDDAAYDSAKVAVTVSAGDGGYGVEFPAADPYVVAVGGTTLSRASNARGWAETVWSGTGSGCSSYEANPGWEPVTSACARRTVGDVAADANPNTGVAVYDSYGESGWLVFGGTSVASPIVASVYALAGYAGSGTSTTSTAAKALYHNSTLNKVTSGTNARRCSTYLCNAAHSLTGNWDGYNGPTGNGTPNGAGGF
jgi:subtilase family serine protease